MQAVNLNDKLKQIDELWSPRIVARVNDNEFKLARIKGEFDWHSHSDTDEAFVVLDGEMILELRDRQIPMRRGDMFVVPSGVEHRPVAESECQILLLEKQGTINTGDQGDRGDEGTAGVWI